MLKLVLGIIKQRLATFTNCLVTEGKTTALIHGLLSFFKHVFHDMQFDKSDAQSFSEWRDLYHSLLAMCLEINRICAGLLSNNRLTQEGKDLVDCRGHPVGSEPEQAYGDYENLVLVGIWLAVKENGELMSSLIEWSELPQGPDDTS
jgi:hypothetical protein